tara:strand:- start:50 stop:604 length:555 start_codon:yes stop_codon:yes gene_type:complete
MEKIYRETKDGKIIKGIGLPAFIHNMQYHLVTIKVYEDGVIDCWEKVDFEGFIDKVNSGRVVTKIPKGEDISRFHSFFGKSDGLNTYIDEREFIKEVKDTLDQLQGRTSSSERCRDAFIKYLQFPSVDNANKLKEEYTSTPEHLRRYVLGDMDSKDGPIKYVLEGKEVNDECLNRWRERYNVSS